MNTDHGTKDFESTTPSRTSGAIPCSVSRVRRSSAGFSLIELIVVVTIIGILASVAVINVRWAQQRAREAALKENLFELRKAIDNFYADKQKYPANLQELVPNYIRRIPKDPITNAMDWEEVMENPLGPEGELLGDTDPDAMGQPGVVDVKSSAQGMTLDNVPFSEL